jgi:cell wall-associated NlpC family hydrolase
MVAHYQSLLGVSTGSATQRAVEAFAGEARDAPWCASFFWYVTSKLSGYNGPRPSNVAYVPAWEDFARARGILRSRRNALPGMAVTFVWQGPHGVGRGDHIGIILKPGLLTQSVLFTDEGNAGSPGRVRQETRYWWQVNTVFDLAQLQHA